MTFHHIQHTHIWIYIRHVRSDHNLLNILIYGTIRTDDIHIYIYIYIMGTYTVYLTEFYYKNKNKRDSMIQADSRHWMFCWKCWCLINSYAQIWLYQQSALTSSFFNLFYTRFLAEYLGRYSCYSTGTFYFDAIYSQGVSSLRHFVLPNASRNRAIRLRTK